MKKSLFALAAVGALAGTAQAQSSVTVYGIMDLGYAGGNSTTSTTTTAKSTGSTFTDSAEQTSRLGFKGTEDLGSGLSAFFTIELAITPNSAQTLSSSSTSNRQTFVGLKKNGVGDFAFGTQYTPIHNAVSLTDPGMTNNVVGNVVYNRNSPGALAASTTTYNVSGNDTNSAYVVRQNNMLTVNSANFGGFTGHAVYQLNNANSTETVNNGSQITGGNNNVSGWGLGADFAYNKFYATAAYQAFKAIGPIAPVVSQTSTTPAVAAVGTATIFGLGGASAAGTNVQDNGGYLAATYDFGILKAYAQYVTRKASYVYNSNYFVKRSGEQIGVRSFITPTIEGWASAGVGRYTGYGVGQPTANFNAWQLGSNYWLSKRTNLYAIIGAENTSNYATVNNTTGVASNSNSYNANGYAIGVRHTF